MGKGRSLIGRLLVYDALDAYFRDFQLKKNDECPLCSEKAVIKELDKRHYRDQTCAIR